MARSVMVPGDALTTVYMSVSAGWDGGSDWIDFLEDLRIVLQSRFKSLQPASNWVHNEAKRILTNGRWCVIVCGYCGVVSVSVCRERDFRGDTRFNSATFRGAMLKAYPGDILVKLGTFSNGESVYERV